MNKLKHILILVITLTSLNSISQTSLEIDENSKFKLWLKTTQNHKKGMKSIGGFIGGTKYSIPQFYSVEGSYFITDKYQLGLGLSYDFGLIGMQEYTDMFMNINNTLTLLKYKKALYLNARLGLRGGLQNTIEVNQNTEFKSFIYGASIGVEVEYFIGSIGLSLQFNEISTLNTIFGNFHYNLSGGLKYNFK